METPSVLLKSQVKDGEVRIHSFVPKRDEFGNVARRVVYVPVTEGRLVFTDVDGRDIDPAVGMAMGVKVFGFRFVCAKIDELHVHSVSIELDYSRENHFWYRVELYCFEE